MYAIRSRLEREREAYEASLGRPPRNLPDDHPDAWQWKYTGAHAERELLMELIEREAEETAPEQGGLF